MSIIGNSLLASTLDVPSQEANTENKITYTILIHSMSDASYVWI